MSNVTKNYVSSSAIARIRNRANNGIVWGTNNYPAGALSSWFAGTTSGRSNEFLDSALPGPDIDADATAAALRAYANLFSNIRLTRIVIYKSTDTGSTVQSDSTQVANTSRSVNFANNVVMPNIVNGRELQTQFLNADIEALYSAYVSTCRQSTTRYENTICHSSCHTDCHVARGRR